MLTESLLNQFTAADRERQDRIRTAWQRYNGHYPDALLPTKGDPEGKDNVKLNYSRLFVNKSVSALFGFDLSFEVDGGGGRPQGQKESAEEQWLEACWVANRKMTTLHKAAINGGVAGDTFLRILPADPPRNGHAYPRLVLWDPADVTVRWDPFDIDVVWSYTRKWHGVDAGAMRPVAYRQVVERLDGGGWEIRTECSRGMSMAWDPVEPPVVWEHDWAPVFHAQNLLCPGDYWGFSDLELDLLLVMDKVNFTLSNTNRIYRSHGHPQTYVKGAHSNVVQFSADGVLCLPNGAEINNLEMSGDLDQGLGVYDRLRQALHELARIPEVATGKLDSAGDLSGVAIEILHGPLVELTSTKRLTYGELLADLGSRLLELGGFGAGHTVKPQWPKVTPNDRKAEADTADVLKTVGVSTDTVLSELGYDPAAEAVKKAAEARADQALGKGLLDAFGRGQNELPEGGDGGPSADELAKRANAAGILIRSGFAPEAALEAVGLDPIQHLGLLPVTLQADG